MLGLVSTWMGDRLGTPDAVGIPFFTPIIDIISVLRKVCMQLFALFSRQRPYHVENTSSRPITEVKQRWVWLVLGWVTAWEHQMLLASLFYSLLS